MSDSGYDKSVTPTARLRHRLLHRIQRRYQTAIARVHLGGREFLFTRIADPDVVLDQVAAEEDRREKVSGRRSHGDELHLPYWAELWDSALGLGQLLLRREAARNSNGIPLIRSALDLGCGMGLAGTVAAAIGCDVTFADLETPALLFALYNALAVAAPDRLRTRRLNWRSANLGERFDLILGADILYEKIQWEFLELFWRAHLAPAGSVLLAEPGRQTGELFIEWISNRPWKLNQLTEKLATRAQPIRLFELTIEN